MNIIEQLRSIREQLTTLETQLAPMFGEVTTATTAGKKRGPKPGSKRGGRKRVMSPEARAKIAAAQKARWAKQKAK